MSAPPLYLTSKPPLKAKATTANWERMFKVLRFFKKAHGHCEVRAKADPGSLGHWLAEQRKEYRAGRIRPERLRRLERLGIDFGEPGGGDSLTKIKRERRWGKRLAELADFKKRYGHCEVGRGSKASHGLAVWMSSQRQLANAGRLRPDRWQRLRELGVKSGRTDRRWNLRFEELAGYKQRFGHCDVPCQWRENPPLSYWVSSQRSFRNKGWLRQERIDRLDQLGFKWVARYNRLAPPQSYQNWILVKDRHWDSMLAALLKYKKKQGDCNVRPDDGLEGRLHGWVLRQRSAARENWLREDRRRRLDQAGFLWKQYNPAWDKRFSQLLAFKKRFGHCDVPCHWPKDRLLGHWVSNQRSFRKKGGLSQERIDRLNQIGFRWVAVCRLEAPPQSFREPVKGAVLNGKHSAKPG
jgi:Helicase associated domain